MNGLHVTILFGIEPKFMCNNNNNNDDNNTFNFLSEIGNLGTKCINDYGGYTITECIGGWLSMDGQHIHEKSLKLEIDIIDEITHKKNKIIEDLSEWIKNHFKQTKIIIKFQEITYL